MVNWKQQTAQRGFYMKRICIVFIILLLFLYFNMFVWTPSEPDTMSSQASALAAESSSASASPYFLEAIGADDTAAVLDGYPVKETVVAVIDTGAELSHEDLADSLWINEAEQNGADNVDDDGNGYIDDIYGVDFINNVPTPIPDDSSAPLRYEAPEDDSNTSHGTHVSGIIGMNPDNAVGYAGVGYHTKIMILKAGNSKNSFSFANATKAVEYAVANGADVINMSFGSYNENSTFAEELEKASSSCLLVAAAGNDGRASSNSTMYPAAYPYVIGIMAGNTTDGCWTSSNFVDTSPAPYDILCPGESILSTTRYNSYAEKSGTSMASPMAAGSAAVIMGFLEANKTYENREDLLADTKKYLLMSDSVYTYVADSGLIYITPRLNLKNSLLHIIEDLKKETEASASPAITPSGSPPPTITPSGSPAPTKTPLPTSSATPTATETPARTSTPSTTPVVSPSPTDSAIPVSPSPAGTPAGTSTPTISPSPASSATPGGFGSPSESPAVSGTPSPGSTAVSGTPSPGITAVPGTTASAKKFDTKSLKIKKVTQKKKGKHKLTIKWEKCKTATRYQIRVKYKKNGETRWFYTKKTKITLTRSKKMQVSIRAQKVSGKKIWSGSYKRLPRVG